MQRWPNCWPRHIQNNWNYPCICVEKTWTCECVGVVECRLFHRTDKQRVKMPNILNNYLTKTTINKRKFISVIITTLVFIQIQTVSIRYVSAVPTTQQEQDLLLLDALGRRQSNNNNNNDYGPNSIMDMLGRSNAICFLKPHISLTLP